VPQSFTVNKGNQTISFTSTAPSNATVAGPTYTVTATATSGLAVTFTIDSSATSVCSISGSTVSFTAAGTCVIDANQAGNGNWNAAPQAQQSFTVSNPISATTLASGTTTTDCKSSGTGCSTASVTTTSGRTILIAVYWVDGNNDAISSITGPFTGGAATLITGAASHDFAGTTGYDMEIWQATGNGTSSVVTVKTGKTSTIAAIDVIQLSGNDTTTPVVASNVTNSTGGGSTTATATLTSPAAGDAELVLFGAAGANASFTTPTGFSSIDSGNGSSPSNYGFRTVFDAAAQTSASSTVAPSAKWGTIALEIKHA
jgi:hypothetical protein